MQSGISTSTRSGRVLARLSADPGIAPAPGAKLIELVHEVEDINKEWPPEFLAYCIDVTSLNPRPQIGWVLAEGGILEPPPAAVQTREQEMYAALASGLLISTVHYHAIGPRWEMLRDEADYALRFSAFAGGVSSLNWTAMSGDVVLASTDQLIAVYRQIYDWRIRWSRYVDGKLSAAPA